MEAYSLLIAIVRRGFAEKVMIAAQEAGAKGGTIINGRGTGSLDASKFLGVSIEPEKEIILIITEKSIKKEIMIAINKAAGLSTEGNGIVISLPAEDVIGFSQFTNDIEE